MLLLLYYNFLSTFIKNIRNVLLLLYYNHSSTFFNQHYLFPWNNIWSNGLWTRFVSRTYMKQLFVNTMCFHENIWSDSLLTLLVSMQLYEFQWFKCVFTDFSTKKCRTITRLNKDKEKLINESSDLLYHLIVSWVYLDIDPEDVWSELKKRDKFKNN